MAKLTDPDSFTVAVNATATTEEVEIQTAAKTVELRVAGNLNDTAPGKDSGATAKAVYSFLKEEWLTNATLRRHRFPLKMIFEGSFIWVNGWAPQGQQTRDLFRDAGFQEQSSQRENACIVSLGNMVTPGSDLGYYQQAAGFTASTTAMDKTGEVNENIQILGAGGTPDNRSYLKLHLREQGKSYAEYNLLTEQGLSTLTFQAYRLPLANATDIKVTNSDAFIDANPPYTGMEINYLKGNGFTQVADTTYALDDVVRENNGAGSRWFFCTGAGTVTGSTGVAQSSWGGTATWAAYWGEEQIGASWYAFNRIITCNSGTIEQVHEYAMRSLRQTGNINADNVAIPAAQRGFGTVNGNVAKLLTEFVGDTIKPLPGVLLRGFDANDTNDIIHRDITMDGGGLDSESVPVTTTERPFPFVSAGTFSFASNIVAQPDAQTRYTVYFDYITRTVNTNIGVASASGQTANITWTGTTLDHLQTGDWLITSGFTNAGNNGVWEVTGTVTAGTSAACTKRDLTAPVNEAAAASVTVDENPFNTPGAVIVNDNSATAMDAQVTAASINWDFDYTNNNQGGRTANSNAPCTIVALAQDGAEWVEASFTITQTTGISVAVNPADERNYSNPA